MEIRVKYTGEKLFELALEASPSGLLMMNTQGFIVLVNSKIEEIFGYSREELINQPLDVLVPHAHRNQHPNYREQFLINPRSRAMGTGRDLYGLHKDGQEVPLEIGLNPLEIEGATYVLASVVNISERKLAEVEKRMLNDRIQMAQRMESLGVLAGGTAHDFNNILYAISGNAELALMRTAMGESVESYLNNIIKSCTRASDLTKQMLAYAGKGKISYSNVNLNELIGEMLELLESTIPKEIKVNTALKKNLPVIEADGSQLQQIILNLITNASESMENRKGEITIRTGSKYENTESLSSYRVFDYLQEGEYIFLEVSDTGCGMPQEVIENMFDPFYTTKFTGRGLGMAAVLGIIRSHFGSVRVESEVGVGSRIRIIFPLIVNMSVSSDLKPKDEGLNVLIVDDEPEVRNVLKQMLEVNNFKVTEAKTGNEALKIIDRDNNNYELFVLDMNMPGMTGLEVYTELKKRKLAAKIIFISGYNEEEVLPLFMPESDDDKKFSKDFLQKPFKYNDIKQLLDKLFEA